MSTQACLVYSCVHIIFYVDAGIALINHTSVPFYPDLFSNEVHGVMININMMQSSMNNDVTLPNICAINNLWEFCNNILNIKCVLPFELGAKSLRFRWIEQVAPPKCQSKGPVAACQLSDGGGKDAPAPHDPSLGGGDKFQDGFSLLRNRSDRSLDVLADRGMLVRPCS